MRKILSYPLEYVDYFLLNEVEASDICGIEATKDPQALMNGLVKRFPEAKIVLTLGGDGSSVPRWRRSPSSGNL